MIKEAIGTGNTVEEATEDAKLQLGVKEDEELQIDVVSMPKKKVMGLFGGSKAEVKVSVVRPDEKPLKKKNHGVKKEKKFEKKVKETPVKETAKSQEEQTALAKEELPADSKALKAVNYLEKVLAELGCENIEIKTCERQDGALLFIKGEGLGVLIGHRGETLDALQHLASLAARDENGYYKVTLNVGNYREKREITLTALANRIAQNVIKTGKGKALEPMNPYERRIIHTAIQEIEGVTSASVGEGENRRVVVVLEGGNINDVRFDRPHHRDRSGRYDRRGGRNSRPSNKVASPDRAPRSDNGAFPLYGKIEPKN